MVLSVIRTRGKHFQTKKAKYSPFFTEKRQVHRSPFTVHRSPFAVRRSPFTVRRSPARFGVQGSGFGVWRAPFVVCGWRHMALTITLTPNLDPFRPSRALCLCGEFPFAVRRSPFRGAQARSAKALSLNLTPNSNPIPTFVCSAPLW